MVSRSVCGCPVPPLGWEGGEAASCCHDKVQTLSFQAATSIRTKLRPDCCKGPSDLRRVTHCTRRTSGLPPPRRESCKPWQTEPWPQAPHGMSNPGGRRQAASTQSTAQCNHKAAAPFQLEETSVSGPLWQPCSWNSQPWRTAFTEGAHAWKEQVSTVTQDWDHMIATQGLILSSHDSTSGSHVSMLGSCDLPPFLWWLCWCTVEVWLLPEVWLFWHRTTTIILWFTVQLGNESSYRAYSSRYGLDHTGHITWKQLYPCIKPFYYSTNTVTLVLH